MASGSGWGGRSGGSGKKNGAKSRRERYQKLKGQQPRRLNMRGTGRRSDDYYLPF